MTTPIVRCDVMTQLPNKSWEFRRYWLQADHPMSGFAYGCVIPGSTGLSGDEIKVLVDVMQLREQGDVNLLRTWQLDTQH